MELIKAEHFVNRWIKAWNNHDLEAIMDHYADEVDFNSPFVCKMGIDKNGFINNKIELKKYFEQALKHNPELHFDLLHILTGSHSIVMFYKRMNKNFAAEYVDLDEHGRIIKSRSHYTESSLV